MAGGGTGGHVYPALAIADALTQAAPHVHVAFAGTRDRLEATAVPKAGYAFHPITVSGFQRAWTLENLRFPLRLLEGLWDSWKLVRALEPAVVVGTGGYVAGPVLLAARLQGCPIVVQEQNAYPGVTNRLLGYLSTRVHVAFPEAEAYFPTADVRVTGNPTRQQLQQTTRAEGRAHIGMPEDATLLTVLGGSLGSAALNDALEASLGALLDRPNTYILWQTGTRYYEALHARIPSHPRLRMAPYLDRMDAAYAATDVALCRAGALTCSELLVTGTPAVLVPSPNVVADHQTKNAESMAAAGAARVLPEPRLSSELVAAVTALLDDASARAAMTRAAQQLARPEAAAVIARDICSIARAHSSSPTPHA